MAESQHISGLPLFVADLAAPPERFEPGAPFWKAVEKLAPDDRLSGQLDQLLAGASAPRIWLLLHEPGQPQLSAVAALMLARALNARGQNVLVLDVDESGSALTIWAEREETEGWIDVARFGASVLASGIDLPFRGGRGLLLGVGSFVPTDVTGDEIASLLGRLRHQADDILLVAAVGPAALPWARRAERRLFCWDRTVREQVQLARVTGPFAAEGVPLTGLVAYGEPAVAGHVPADVSADLQPGQPAEEPAFVAAFTAEAGPEDISATVPEAVPESVTESVPEPTVAVAGAQEPVLAAPPPPPSLPRAIAVPDAELGIELEPPRGTPRMFWAAAAVFGVALVAIAWYWTTHVRVPPGGYFEPVVTREEPEIFSGDSTAVITSTAGAVPDSAAAAAVGDAVSVPRVAEAGGTVSMGDTLPGARVVPAAPGRASSATGGEPSGTAAPFDRSAYTVPAGQAGWALHVYSLADSASAAKQVDELERSGIRAAVRIVEIKEKGGRWWRVYVGSFPTKSAANAALPALLARLKASWAEPARIQDSAP